MDIVSHSENETKKAGEDFGRRLKPGSIICFRGDLGAGKTTFIKGLVYGASGCLPDTVSSPTFVYLNIYEGTQTIYHFDLYRLNNKDDFIRMGFDEMLFEQGISCIEWSERLNGLLIKNCIHVSLSHLGESKRQITIKGNEFG